MEALFDHCAGDGCGKYGPIVNKKHYLCDACNYKRLHHGKSKEDVYAERAKSKGLQGTYEKRPPVDLGSIKGVTKASKIKQVSDKDKFRCSDGTIVSQMLIKRKYAEACDKIKQTRPAMCQGTGRWDVPLSFSHTISQDDCKKLGKTELIWDERNIELEGFEAPTSNPEMAHNIWEVGSIEKKIMLLNFDRKVEFIKEHDPVGYNKLMVQLEELEQKLYERENS